MRAPVCTPRFLSHRRRGFLYGTLIVDHEFSACEQGGKRNHVRATRPTHKRRSDSRGGVGCTAPGKAPEPRPNSKLASALTDGRVGPRVVGDHADGSTPFAHLPIDEHFAWKRVNGQRSGWATEAPESDAPSKSPHRSKLRRAHLRRAPGRCIEACHANFRL